MGNRLHVRLGCVRTDNRLYSYVHNRELLMSSSANPAPRPRRPTRKGKVRKEFWLDPKTLRRAQVLLGAETERDTVELALDLVAFRQELLSGAQALAGLKFGSVD